MAVTEVSIRLTASTTHMAQEADTTKTVQTTLMETV
jgi:hypothetical protein